MADYINIFGQKIQYLSSDPSPVQQGQVWYNSTSNKLKYQGASSVGSWATGGTLNRARRGVMGAGIQTAALAISGNDDPPVIANVESYNGSSWTEITDVNSARTNAASDGTQTSAIIGGGDGGPSNALTETWNGSSWTEVSDLNTGRDAMGGAGTVPAFLAFGGWQTRSETELWNGSSWSAVNALNTGRSLLAGAGTSTSAICMSGYTGSAVGNVETWNGSSWTEVTDVNTAVYGSGGAGDSNSSSLKFTGTTPGGQTNNVEIWNGSSWTETANLSQNSYQVGGTGTTASGLAFGGSQGNADINYTEEWSGPGSSQTNTIATS